MRRKTRWIALIAGCVALDLYLVFGTGPALHPPSDLSDLLGMPGSPVRVTDVSALEDEITIERDVAVMTRDGTRLSANVFRPNAPGRFPVVMTITAYGMAKLGIPESKRKVIYDGIALEKLDPTTDPHTFRRLQLARWIPSSRS